MQVSSGDGLPEYICDKCATSTINMYLFKLQCEKSDKILRERLLQKSVFVEVSLPENENQFKTEEILVEEENVVFEEKVVEDKSDQEQILLDHLENLGFDSFDNESEPDTSIKENETKSQVKLKEFHCEICQKQFSRNDLLLRHKIAHAIKMEDSKLREHKKADKGTVIYSEDELKSEELLYSCAHCDIFFVHKNDFDYHFKENHEKKGEFNVTCDMCGEKFSKLAHKNRHMKKVHLLDRQYKCPTCEKTYYKKEHLEHHINTHLGKKPHTCDICLKGKTVVYLLSIKYVFCIKFFNIKIMSSFLQIII